MAVRHQGATSAPPSDHAPRLFASDDADNRLSPPARLVQLARATSLAERGLRRALQRHTSGLGLNDAELLVLWSAARGRSEGVAQHQLVAEIGLSAAQVSNLLDGLRRSGYVQSRRAENDRRRQLWRLEPPGEQLLSDALAEIGRLAEAVIDGLSVEDQAALEKLLHQVRIAADRSRESASADAARENSVSDDGRTNREAA
ncbi:MAG: MarR family transcriptional regulator [Pirellulaceae bacterium]